MKVKVFFINGHQKVYHVEPTILFVNFIKEVEQDSGSTVKSVRIV